MKYKSIVRGTFISRPNRFIAHVEINGRKETVHIKNTGRCKEILTEGAVVFLALSDNPQRKTAYDLIGVEKKTQNGTILINIDSQIPNFCAEEFLPHSGLFSESVQIKREVTYKKSRFDIFFADGKRKGFIEVKGVTLENDGAALFPDAPTERGIKHLNELRDATKNGYEAYVLFVVQMEEIRYFSPNTAMHPEFSEALKAAEKDGVKILCYNCFVSPDTIEIRRPVPVILS